MRLFAACAAALFATAVLGSPAPAPVAEAAPNPVAVAEPSTTTIGNIILPWHPKCGECQKLCSIKCEDGTLCKCPLKCDIIYRCPIPIFLDPVIPKVKRETPYRPLPTCGRCLNDCVVNCPVGKSCNCPKNCDPKYFCPTKTSAVPTPTPTWTCGCTNDCLVNCPPGEVCGCPKNCDPKYACPTTTKPVPSPKPTCGCLNDCLVNCPPGEVCACPRNCDPKYFCRETTTLKEPTPIATFTSLPKPTCGPCLNECLVNCPPGKACGCPRYCDPKYECPTQTLPTLLPTPTSGPKCGCLNDCVVNCPPGIKCNCLDYCDPKYECPAPIAKEKRQASDIILPIPPRCGPCTNSCKINCPAGKICICPQYCDPRYECPTRTRTIDVVLPTDIPTATLRPTCGPCLNDCIVNCPPGALCKCPDFCDPKYECPKPPCGDCLNDCIVNCPKGALCKCPAYCDPKYLCKIRKTKRQLAEEVVKPIPIKCGCTNACKINCPPGENCICPQHCDPAYLCPPVTLIPPTSTVKPTPTPRPTCGPCLNGCIVNCPPGALCKCPDYCDPKYECPSEPKPCGPCLNDCIIANCVPNAPCKCPDFCDPRYECPVKPKPCGPCLNDCIVNCPDLALCKCAHFCDPKYFCPEEPKPKCGCHNSCTLACKPGDMCICPAYCDPKYMCVEEIQTLTPITLITIPKPTKKPTPTESFKTLITEPSLPIETCGPCLNECIVNCPKPGTCKCPKNCDPAYRCK